MRTIIHVQAAIFLALVISLTAIGPAAAQEGEVAPCGGESVSGKVVAVDEETGVVTLDTGAGLCTVTLDGDYDHPIVALLGSYFGDASADSLAAALETTQGCAVQDAGSGTWTWADCDAEGAVAVTVIGANADGTFVALTADGEEVNLTVEDAETAADLTGALETLQVTWDLDGEGGVVQVGGEIAAYHEDGIGFGVLVKLYAMAAASQELCAAEGITEACGVTVEELVETFQSGTGMGQLFQEYGRPSALGVGHVRQRMEVRERERTGGPPDHAGPKDGEGPQGNPGPPPHAGPKDKDRNEPGPPAHAGPKKPR